MASSSSFSWAAHANLHESDPSVSTIIGAQSFGSDFDTSIRFFGDSATGDVGSNPSVWHNSNFDPVHQWPFTFGSGGTSEYDAYVENQGNGITVDAIDVSAQTLDLGIDTAPWMAIELFNTQLPLTYTAWSDYPLWSPTRSIVGFNINLQSNLNGTIVGIRRSTLEITVLEQRNWPAGGVEAEIFIAEAGTDVNATWSTKNGVKSWSAAARLATPFDNNILGGHSAVAKLGGGSVDFTGTEPSMLDRVSFTIPKSLPNDIITVDVTNLIDRIYQAGDYGTTKDIVFLIRAAYWPNVNDGPFQVEPIPPDVPIPPGGPGNQGGPQGGPGGLA